MSPKGLAWSSSAAASSWVNHITKVGEAAPTLALLTAIPIPRLSRAIPLRIGAKRRCLSTQASSTGDFQSAETPIPPLNNGSALKANLGHAARQKQTDREFFADILSSAATKRDAKAYLSRLKSPKKHILQEPESVPKTKTSPAVYSKLEVNTGNLFGRARAVDASPVFTQYNEEQNKSVEEEETLHVALVKIVDVESLDEDTLQGLAQTLSQLSRLSMAPCVVLEPATTTAVDWRHNIAQQADRLVGAIDTIHEPGARSLDNIFSIAEDSKTPTVFLRKLLLRPLRRGQIPVIIPMAYCTTMQTATQVSADEAVLALTKELAGLNSKPTADQDPIETADYFRTLQKQVSLDRVIILDGAGAIPSPTAADKTHVFVNLDQEYSGLQEELTQLKNATRASRHMSNLRLQRDALRYLPPSSSGLITTPADAAHSSNVEQDQNQVSRVGTRRQKNSLIHNLLTDKPAYSSSLPSGRLGRNKGPAVPPVTSSSTFVKRGMPLTILPNPVSKPWAADNYGEPRLTLTDPRIDLPRLVHLIDDSFNRKLDVEDYLNRVNDRIAGVIIAGEYEGGALLTWETPPGAEDGDSSRLVPYLDKFAVLKRSQGAGGVADILFNAMVRTCFPNGVCWRSRKDNPVNKWYFERSRGTWKIPDTNWTMFWTTPGVVSQGQTFLDYEGVCRGVMPSWADKKQVVD